ncbi:uncharacterized protein [Nicotiana sylvestris]|uniref:uncharacterized protein n=1 Tax=Nicotiana sylvestris TaxID=4096 RepID=UPI00388C872B
MIKNYPHREIEWNKERAKRRNRKKEQVQPKRNKGSTKAMVAAWREISDEDSEDEDGDEQTLMINKERLSELLLDFIDESEIINNEKEELSRECVILKAKCKNLESRANESDNKNAELKNHVLELDNSVLEIRSENLKLKLGIGKKKADHTHLTLEENLGKIRDELYRKDEKIRVLKEDIGKVKNEQDRTCKLNKASDALSWLQEHHSSNKRGLGYGTQAPTWDPKIKYLTLLENKICTHCGKNGHYKNELLDETNILSERQEHEDEAIGLVKDLSEVSAQAKVEPKEGIGDGIGSSIKGNLTVGTDQRRTETNPLKEPVHDPVPQ